MSDTWDESIISLLEDVRANSAHLSEHHRKNFFAYKGISIWLDIPSIILSAFGSSWSVGSQPYFHQGLISLVNCAIGFTVAMIGSIKLYLNIEDSKKIELDMSKDFYALSIDIYKMLNLNPHDRGIDGMVYLNKSYNLYQDLVRRSNLLNHRFKKDKLIHIQMIDTNSNTISSIEESKEEV